jgi:hypothetical protein
MQAFSHLSEGIDVRSLPIEQCMAVSTLGAREGFLRG